MGTTTAILGIYKPDVSETGWGALRNTSYDTLDTALGTQHDLTGEHRFITVTDSSGYIKFPSLTTIERDALPVADGFTIYNTTTATLQTRQAGVWADVVTAQLTVREQDLTPSISNVNTIQFPNDSLTDLGSGVVSVDGFVEHTEGVVSGDMLYFDGVFWSRFAPGTAGQRLITNGPGSAPTWETGFPVPSGSNNGDMLYFDGVNWVSFAPGISGQHLRTNGIGSPPVWETLGAGGNVSTALNLTDNAIVRGDGGASGVQTSSVLIDDTDNVTGIVNLTTTGTLTLNTVAYTFPGADAAGVLTSDGAGNLSWAAAGGGTFLSLTDTPANYTAQALNLYRVNAGATAVESVTPDYGIISAGDAATDVTGAELETLTDGSNADALHTHAGGGSASTVTFDINQTTHGFSVGDWIRHNGTIYVTAQADTDANSDTLGVVSAVAGVDDFTLFVHGHITGLSGLTVGEAHFLSESAAGTITATPPSAVGEIVKPVIIADSATTGYVNILRGNEITASSGITVDDEGTPLTTNVSSIDFVGAGVVATNSGDDVTVTIAGGGGATLTEDVNQTTHGFSVNDWVYHNGTIYALADASAASTAESIGVVSAVAGVDDFTIQFGGKITGLTGLTAGEAHFLSETAGAITATSPTTIGAVSKPVLVADSTTTGFIFNMRGSLNTDQASVVGSFTSGSLTAGVLTVNHALGNKFVQVQVFDDSDQLVQPDDITLTDGDNLDIDLNSFTVSGTWNYVILDSGATTGIGNTSFVQSFVDADLTAGVLTVAHGLNQQYCQVQVFNNNDDMVIPDDVTLTDADNLDVDLSGFGTLTGTWRAVILSSGSTISSTATDLSLAGQAAEDTTFYDGANWVTRGGTEKIVNGLFSRDTSLASGNQAVTGVGFQPSYITFHGCVPGTSGMSIGACDGDLDNHCGFSDINPTIAGGYTSSSVYAIQMREGTSALQYQGLVASMDSDGFTITWTKTGATTGTANIYFTAHR